MKKRIFSALLVVIMVLSMTTFTANVAAFDLPVGDEHMPDDLQIGENNAEISENSSGYYYNFTAEQNGTLTMEIIYPDYWTYVVNNLTTSTFGDSQWSDGDPVINPYSIEVAEGDLLEIIVNSYDPSDMFNTPACTITIEASFTPAETPDDDGDTDELTQNEDGYYEIGSATDFEAFAALVNDGECDINAVMTADFELSYTDTMIGTYSDYPYSGNFDGANHTLTIDYSGYEEYFAPFRFVESATIENLIIEGEIYTDSKFAAGLIGESKGYTVINNCISDIVITSDVYGDGTHGGLVAVNRESLAMTNCAFVGKMQGDDTDSNGGLVGWTDSDMSMTNCYVAAIFNTSPYNSNTFVRNDSPNVTLTNCYYVYSYGGTRGATNIGENAVSSGELAYKLNGSADGAFRQTIGEDEYPNFTGDAVYFNFGENVYTNTQPPSYTITVDEDTQYGTISATAQAYEGDVVTVTVDADQGYVLDTLIVMNGDVSVATNGNTFVMPAGDVTVTATFKLRTDIIIGENESTSTNIRIPFECFYYNSVSQYVIPAEKLQYIDGKLITDISYFYDASDAFALDQELTIYVEEGNFNNDSSNYLPLDNATKIYEGTLDIVGETTTIEELKLNLNTPFVYNGGDLLFTVFKQSSETYSSLFFITIPSEIKTLYSFSDSIDFKNDGFESAYVRNENIIPKMKFDVVSAEKYNITIADNIENGSITSNSDSTFASANVSLTVTPDEGYVIDTVTYNDGNDHVITPVNGVYSFTMPASDVTVSATFRVQESYSITVDDSISFGTVEAPESAYEETTVTLTITPDTYCVLDTITVMQGETPIEISENYTFTMPSGDVTVTATFSYPDIWVGGTRITPDNASDVFGDGKVSYNVETGTLTLDNYTYTGKGVDVKYSYDNTSAVIYSKNSLNLVISGENFLTHQAQDCRVSAVIFGNQDITFSGNGSLVATACDAEIYSYGIYCQQGDVTFNSGTITATSGNSPTSYGILVNYDIYFNGGIVTAYGSFTAIEGTFIFNNVELIEPADGYIDTQYIFDENSKLAHNAMIGPAEKYTISATVDGNGTVLPNVTNAIAGKKIRLDIQADEGYGLDTLTVMQGDVPVEVAEDYTFIMPEGNVAISATFRILNNYTITVDENIENGTVTAPESACERSTVTLTVTPEDGYSLSRITVMQGEIPVEVSKDFTFVMPEGDVTVSAVFKEKTDFIIGENANLTSETVPFNTFYKYSISQYVIPADMLTEANNDIITGITYYYTPASSTTRPITLKIYLQEIAESYLEDDHFTSFEEAQMVHEGTYNLSTDTTAVHELPLNFDVGYMYNGGNMLVTVIKTADNYFTALKIPSISGYSRIYETDNNSFNPENITTYSTILEGRIPKCKISYMTATPYDVTVDDSIENGTVTASADSAVVGSSVTLTVTPDEGYILDTLNVMQGNTPVEVSEDYTFVMPEGNVTVSAIFRVVQSYAITIDENIENGTVTSPESAYEGTTVTLTIKPDISFVIETLTVMQGDVAVEVSDDFTFVMPTGNVTISATFKEQSDLIIGENATNTIGYVPFRMFYNNAVSQYVIPANMLKTARGNLIADLTYYYTPQSESTTAVTLSVYLSNIDIEDFTPGSFVPLTGVQKAYEGTLSNLSNDSENVHEMMLQLNHPYYYNGGDLLVTVFKSANEYFADLKFQSIEGVASYTYSDDDIYSPDSIESISAKASEWIPKTKLGFAKSEVYNITLADGIENGTVTVNTNVNIEGGKVVVTATPNEGYAIGTVTYNDGEEDHVIIPENGVYSFTMPAGDVTVSASFYALSRYTITVDENISHGTIEVAESAYEHSTVTIQVTPDDGCVLLNLSVMQGENIVEVSDDYTFVMPAGDVTISASFYALSRYTITVDENISHGTIEVAESAYEHSTVTIQVTPDDGCVLLNLSVMQGENIVEVSDDYTFEMPEGDVTITATFGYPLMIGGVNVTFDNASDIFGDGTAAYSVNDNTLTLNNYTYNGEAFKVSKDYNAEAVIAYTAANPLTIVLNGNNSITVTDANTTTVAGVFSSADLTISGTGSLNVEVRGERITYVNGIYALNDVNINGVTLSAFVGDASVASYGIYSAYNISITDSNVRAAGGYAPNSAGIISGHGNVTITNSSVTAEASDIASSHWAIYACEGIELDRVIIEDPLGAYIPSDTILHSDFTIATKVMLSPAKTYTLAGNLDVFGVEWDPQCHANDLIWNNKTGKYEKTYTNVAAGNYKFKVVKDSSWPGYGAETKEEFVENGVGFKLSENANDIGLYLPIDTKSLTFVLDPQTLAVTVTWHNSTTIGVDENGEPTHYSSTTPVNGLFYFSIAQYIIPAEKLGSESKVIEALNWYYYQNNINISKNIKMYLTEIDSSASSNFIPIDESALVYDGNVVFEPTTDDYNDAKELHLKLDTPYNYTGKNLLVTIIDKSTNTDYSQMAFLGISSDDFSHGSSVYQYDDFNEFTIDHLVESTPMGNSGFVPMTKIDCKANAPIAFDGAQIRTEGEQGLRFVFSMDELYYNTLKQPTSSEQTGKGFGSVVLPKNLISTNLTKESEQAGVVPAVVLFEKKDGKVKFTVCLTGITDYEREFSAIPYVTDSAGKTIYGELADGISVYEIAELCYADEKTSESVKEYLLTNILNTVDPEKYPIAE